MRYIGVDLGTKRIGLALSEQDAGIVSPLKVIEAHADIEVNAQAILEVTHDYDATGIVIGLPLNMDGTEGPQAKQSKSLAQMIRKCVGPDAPIQVFLHDERLTSHAADQRLIERELTRKKKKARQDAVAAQILLQSFLECQKP